MRITTQAEYGLICALHLARRSDDAPVTGRDIASSERLPPDYVEQIMLKLRRANIVVSTRGARGGYRLSRSPEDITVRDVISASEHSTFDVHCVTHPVGEERCAESHDCSIRPVWVLLQRRIDEVLNSVRLSDLLLQEGQVRERVGLEEPVSIGARRFTLPVLRG